MIIIAKMNNIFVLFQPGKLLNMVTALLSMIIFVFMLSMFLAFSRFMYKYWILVHIPIFMVSCFVLECARVYDPRKPLPDLFWMKYTRKFCISIHILEQIALFVWMIIVTVPKETRFVIMQNFMIGFIGLVRFVFIIFFLMKEIGNKKVSGLFFGFEYLYLAVKIAIIIISLSKSKQENNIEFLMVFYMLSSPIYSLSIMSVFYGLFREPVRQHENQQHEIQRPPAAVLEIERCPPSQYDCEMV
jgi:hypothetical protein